MVNNIGINEIMTRDVITVAPTDNMTVVDELFKNNNIHHLPVVNENEKVVGLVSSTDYHKLLNTFTFFINDKSEAYNKAILRSLLVQDVMTKHVATLQSDATVMVAAGIFNENLFHAIPVVNNDGMLEGIITTFDLLNYAYNKQLTLP
jgi:CBS-domain-containing membrane protein